MFPETNTHVLCHDGLRKARHLAQTLTQDIITVAIEGLTARQEAIRRQILELRAMLPSSAANDSNPPRKQRGGKRVLSAEARERISEAQRRRWAAAKGESQSETPASATAPKKRRRKLSAEGRAAIVAAAKKRWAAKRAEAAQPPQTKRAAGRKALTRAGKRPTKPAKTGTTTAPAANEATA